MDIGQSIAESRPSQMFWMKNHSSAYFIMPRCPILGKIHDFYSSLFRQNSLQHISTLATPSLSSIKVESKATSQPVNFA